MKRSWNVLLWVGFAIILFGFASYVPVFTPYAITRDVPWVNYLLFVFGGILVGIGLKRAFGQPDRYRGKISGSILGVLSLLMIGFFLFGTLYFSRQIPTATSAAQVGQTAPEFSLKDADGKQVALADLLKGHRGAVLIFYRGYW